MNTKKNIEAKDKAGDIYTLVRMPKDVAEDARKIKKQKRLYLGEVYRNAIDMYKKSL